MTYSKPKIIAENKKAGSFAAGCPTKDKCSGGCKNCDLGA